MLKNKKEIQLIRHQWKTKKKKKFQRRQRERKSQQQQEKVVGNRNEQLRHLNLTTLLIECKWPNNPIKRQRSSDQIFLKRAKPNYMLSKETHIRCKNIDRWKVNSWKKIHHVITNFKKARVGYGDMSQSRFQKENQQQG